MLCPCNKCGKPIQRNISKCLPTFKCIECQREENRARSFLRGRRLKAEKLAILQKNDAPQSLTSEVINPT